MEEICSNCEHFQQVSISTTSTSWGDCRNPANGTGQTGSEIPRLFKWADGNCPDFKQNLQAGS